MGSPPSLHTNQGKRSTPLTRFTRSPLLNPSFSHFVGPSGGEVVTTKESGGHDRSVQESGGPFPGPGSRVHRHVRDKDTGEASEVGT